MASILLVEDSAINAEFMIYFLESQGHEVIWEQSIASADARLAVADFDLSIVDINLPDGSGHTLADKIKAQHKFPVLGLSGYDSNYLSQSLKDTQVFNAFMTKPVDLSKLKVTVEKLTCSNKYSA
jgi:CheY-like chemotaxis protein